MNRLRKKSWESFDDFVAVLIPALILTLISASVIYHLVNKQIIN
jgi:hypothetical protein